MWHALDILIRIPFTGLMFLFFGIGGMLLSWVFMPIMALFKRRRAAKVEITLHVLHRALILFHFGATLFRLIRYRPRRNRLTLPDGPFIMVANHPTLIDVTAILATFGRMNVVVKDGIFRSPAFGRLLRGAWHIRRGAPGPLAGREVINQVLERLNAGMPVLIFPEGTRSPERGVGKFHRGAFEIALQAGVPIVPVLLTCDPPMLMKGQPWYRVPKRTAELRLRALDLIDPATWEGTSRSLAQHVRNLYVGHVRIFYGVDGATESLPPGAVG